MTLPSRKMYTADPCPKGYLTGINSEADNDNSESDNDDADGPGETSFHNLFCRGWELFVNLHCFT